MKVETGARSYPFAAVDTQGHGHKLFGVVTNLAWSGDEVICWLHKRCCRSEKRGSACDHEGGPGGGKFSSGDFGENAAWWWIMLLAFNLHAAMEMPALSKSWACKRMKAGRFALINIPARVLDHARCVVIRLTRSHSSFGEILDARERIAHLVPVGYG
ncbi:MAG: transposase [Deltaproteobacteria bacterium]|jgi:hypothetical protein|nr:transposase [Deltaproteobacteria bacterium]MDX9761481.1 transposase [Desulfomonilia bacterium]